MNSLTIDTAGADDLPTLLAIETDVHLHPWNLSLFENCLRTGNQLPVARIGGADIAGYAVVSCGGGEAELLNLATARQYQGRGVASRLLVSVLAGLQGRAETLFLEVRESNAAARQLYEKLDFNQVGIRPGYYPPGPASKSATGARPARRPLREDALIYAHSLLP